MDFFFLAIFGEFWASIFFTFCEGYCILEHQNRTGKTWGCGQKMMRCAKKREGIHFPTAFLSRQNGDPFSPTAKKCHPTSETRGDLIFLHPFWRVSVVIRFHRTQKMQHHFENVEGIWSFHSLFGAWAW